MTTGLPSELPVTGPAPLRGRLRVPGDKGISHRALIFAALADGVSRITGLPGGDDVLRTGRALRAFGVDVRRVTGETGATLVEGVGYDGLTEPTQVIDCGNSGTTMRTLCGLVAGRDFLVVLTGDASLVARPMARVVTPLRAMGARVDGRADGALPPLVSRGSHLVGTRHQLSVASAQVKTAIALAAMQARGTTEVSEPIPSRDHTERMLAALGAPLSRIDRRTFRLRPGPLTAFELDVPGDPSSAAFWVVAALVTPGSDLVLEGVALNPTRLAFVDVLRRMGAAVQLVPTGEHLGEPVGNIHVVAGPLMATTVLGDEVPLLIDEIPVLAVAAAFAEGTTEFRDAAELRVKESDRIASLVDLLRTLGIAVQPSDDGLTVSGGRPRPGRLPVHGDHRIAMAAAVAANAADGASLVEDWPAVVSSYPEFADDLAALTGRGR